MRLKHLELVGYKSFASKTEFAFNAGITAIVGPNGSGKSNVVDAVRWALGEQSHSTLRAKRTEDMIFTGSSRRPRLGMAQVSLTFENPEGWLEPHPHPITPPLAGEGERGGSLALLLETNPTEVTVTRRAYRSGENEYLINGHRVRLRDVVELLAQGGLQNTTYTVIGQGLVDAALSLRPQERRVLFEEAAGIRLLRAKRENALARLQVTQENLLRLADILSEITPRLRSLERQAKQAEQQAHIADDLREALRQWHGYQWQQALEQLEEARARADEQKIALAQLRRQLDEQTSTLDQSRRRREELRIALAGGSAEERTLAHQVGEAQRRLAVADEGLRFLHQQSAEALAEIEALEAGLAAHRDRVAAAEAERQRLADVVREQRSQLEALQSTLAEQQAEHRRLETEVSAAQERAFQHATTLANRHNRLAQLTERQDELESERRNEERALAALQAQADTLRSHDREHVGYGDSVKAVLDAQLSGIVGVVADLVTIAPEHERAIKAALGERWQAIAVETWDAAAAAIDWLKRTEAGLAAFLPLDSLPPPQLSPASGRGQGGGDVIGLASQFVTAEPRLAPLVDALLGRTLIVRDLATARRLLPSGLQLVTLDGEVVSPDGTISGGAPEPAPRLSAVSTHQTDKTFQEIEWRRAILARLDGELTTLAEKEAMARREAEEAEREAAAAQATIDALREQLTSLADDGAPAPMPSGLTPSGRSLDQGTLVGAGVSEGLAAQAAELRTILATTQQAQAVQETLWRQEQALLEQVEAQLAAKRGRAAQHNREAEELECERERLAAEESALHEQLDAITARVGSAEKELAALDAAQRELDERIARTREDLQQVELAHTQALLDVQRAQDRLSELQRQIEADLEDALVASDLPPDAIAREFQLPSVMVLPEGLEDRIRTLRRDLRQVGVVNPNAPAEYAEVSARHAFLTSQIADLKAAGQSLQEIITRLDQAMQEQFDTTFSTVAEYFQTYFTRLFGGGKARLSLIESPEVETAAEPDEARHRRTVRDRFNIMPKEVPREPGIEIMAKPPEKRSQTLAALSGGERALTATALLFALVKASPAPFCFLDEVDAMLDEANIGRFTEVLGDLSQKTQFVVITHNRGTIEMAETIYGVSMGDDGVSQVISMRLDNQPRPARKKE